MSICNRAHPRHCERSEAIQLSMRRCGLLRCARNDGAIVIRNQSARISARVMPAAFSPIIGALELPPISIGLIAALTCATPRRLVFSASNRLRPLDHRRPSWLTRPGSVGVAQAADHVLRAVQPRFGGQNSAFAAFVARAVPGGGFAPQTPAFAVIKSAKEEPFPFPKRGDVDTYRSRPTASARSPSQEASGQDRSASSGVRRDCFGTGLRRQRNGLTRGGAAR